MKKRLPGETWSSSEDRSFSLDDHPFLTGLLTVGLLLAALYGLVKFVRWAWYS